jgi:hypothetical protein
MYVYDRLKDMEHKRQFLELGEEWWWETNRRLPINIALLNRWPFGYTSQSFNVKQMEIIAGPEVRLSNSITKRIKRRSINLLKKGGSL